MQDASVLRSSLIEGDSLLREAAFRQLQWQSRSLYGDGARPQRADALIFKELNEELVRRTAGEKELRPFAFPRYLLIGNTNLCNLVCEMCFRKEEGRNPSEYPSMEFEVFRRLAEEVFPFLHRVAFSVAGEPLMSRTILEELDLAYHYHVKVDITSNGTLLLKEGILPRLLRTLSVLTVSIDGAKKETFEEIRKGARFEQVLENMRVFNQERQKLPREERPSLHATLVLMRRNIEELPDWVDQMAAIGVNHLSALHMVAQVRGMERESLVYHKALCNEYLKRAKERAAHLKITGEFPPLYCLEAPSGEGGEKKERADDAQPALCPYLWEQAWIHPNGDVVPCCHPAFLKAMGNLKWSSLYSIWNGRSYALLRERFRRGEPLDICRKCYLILQDVNPGVEDAFVRKEE